jgi:hypothetical protein
MASTTVHFIDHLVRQTAALALAAPALPPPPSDPGPSSYPPPPPMPYPPGPRAHSLFHTTFNTSPYRLLACPLATAADAADTPPAVLACDPIPAGAYLGDLLGTRVYAWEVQPHPYLVWVEDDLAIDCAETPRCIFAMMREGFYDGLPCNVRMVVFPDPGDPGYVRVGYVATRDIRAGEELVYERGSEVMP